jgi:hypothetical protein
MSRHLSAPGINEDSSARKSALGKIHREIVLKSEGFAKACGSWSIGYDGNKI